MRWDGSSQMSENSPWFSSPIIICDVLHTRSSTHALYPAGSESGLNGAVSRSDQKMGRAGWPGSAHCIWSTGILLHVRAPRAICMPPIYIMYGYWYVYSQSIFRIQNSEYAFHSICVFSVDFQKHTTSYSDACFWKSTENTHIYRVECIF